MEYNGININNFLDVEECIRFYPPDIKAISNSDEIFSSKNNLQTDTVAIYIHVPFCKSPCGFCPFNQYNYNDDIYKTYLGALKAEMEIFNKKVNMSQKTISSIWIGGGTPLDLTANQLEELLAYVFSFFCQKPINEFTIEGKPVYGMITDEKLQILKKYGVTRISLGVQSTQSKYLALLGRNYTFDQVKETIKRIQDCGLDLNLDMIYRIPNETFEEIQKDVEEICSLGVEHISWFHYISHSGTPLTEKLKKQNIIIDRDKERFFKMYRLVREVMTHAGYHQYTPYYYTNNKKCQYHIDRWSMPQIDVIGFGAGAFSSFNGWIYSNAHNIDLYVKTVEQGISPITKAKEMTIDDKVSRLAVLGCKFFALQNDTFKQLANEDLCSYFGKKIDILKELDLICIKDGDLVCTEKGQAFNNAIAMCLSNEAYYSFGQPQPLSIRKEGL